MVAVKTSDAHLVLTTDPKIDVVDANVDSILTDTATTIPATITTLQADVTAVKAITDVIPNAGALTDINTAVATDIPATIVTIDAFHDVPTADVATNAQMRDVIGNKTDAEQSGPIDTDTSLMAYAKHIHTVADTISSQSGAIAALPPGALPQTGALALWDVTGVVEVISVIGVISTVIGGVANATKLVANSTAGTDVDLCATVDINAAAVGGILSLTGTFANAMILTAGNTAGPTGAIEKQAGGILVTTGSIDVDCAGSDGGGGRVDWVIVWRPMAPGATLVAA